MDIPLFSSFLTLIAMSCLSLTLSLIFYLKFRALTNISTNLSPSIFSKTFNVFNPYLSHRKTLQSFLTILPLLMLACAGFIFLISIKLIESGFVLSIIILIVCLNLVVVEETPEFYWNTNAFIKAFRTEAELGYGDVKVFKVIKKTLPKLSTYYFALTIFFTSSAIALPSIFSSVFLVFTQFSRIILEFSSPAGIWAGYVAVFPLALIIVFVQIVGKKVKDKLFKVTL
jgi:hypothetical protein